MQNLHRSIDGAILQDLGRIVGGGRVFHGRSESCGGDDNDRRGMRGYSYKNIVITISVAGFGPLFSDELDVKTEAGETTPKFKSGYRAAVWQRRDNGYISNSKR